MCVADGSEGVGKMEEILCRCVASLVGLCTGLVCMAWRTETWFGCDVSNVGVFLGVQTGMKQV